MENIRYYLPGLLLILIAVLIVAVPEILVAIVASIVVMAGIGALYIGHRIRRFELEMKNNYYGFSDEDFPRNRFMRRTIFREWPDWF